MDRVRFIDHRGKQVLFVDMTACTPEEALEISEKVQTLVTAQPKQSVLIFADVSRARFDKNALEHIKKAAVYNGPHVKRSAMIGGSKEHTPLKEALKFFLTAITTTLKAKKKRWIGWFLNLDH